MTYTLNQGELIKYIQKQMDMFFPDENSSEGIAVASKRAIERTEYCFSRIYNQYFNTGSEVLFNHLHSDQYCMFLYFLSNTLYQMKESPHLYEKIYYLNKMLNGVDLLYAVEMPEIFALSHPVGTVIGRAKFKNYLYVSKSCTIGSNHGVYPEFGEYVDMYATSSVLGKCKIGDNSKISARSLVLDADVPGNSIYIGDSRDAVVKPAFEINPIWKVSK